MPYSGSLDVTIGNRRLEGVQYTWDDLYSDKRRGEVGWGAAVELPAVIGMARLAAAGEITASDLVERLEALAEMIRAECDDPQAAGDEGDEAWGADCPASGCAVCEAAKEEFEAIAANTVVQRKRLQDPATYPYAAGKHALHSSSCRETRESIGTIPGPDDPWNTEGMQEYNLRRFAHKRELSSSWATFMVMLTPAEAAQWMSKRTGPRGGTRYRLCKVCRPEVPQA